MIEEWKDIEGFEGYQVSSKGNVRSFWKRKHYPTGYGSYSYLSDEAKIMPTSNDGNGYQKLMLYDRKNNKRKCKKVHKLVADAFIPCEFDDYTADHIKPGPEGKLDNSVENLRWLPRGENVRKAYHDGMHNNRILKSYKDIIAIDLWTGDEIYFSSIQEAANELHLNRTSISHVLRGDINKVSHYRFEYAERETRLLYGSDDNKLITWLRHGLR